MYLLLEFKEKQEMLILLKKKSSLNYIPEISHLIERVT